MNESVAFRSWSLLIVVGLFPTRSRRQHPDMRSHHVPLATSGRQRFAATLRVLASSAAARIPWQSQSRSSQTGASTASSP